MREAPWAGMEAGKEVVAAEAMLGGMGAKGTGATVAAREAVATVVATVVGMGAAAMEGAAMERRRIASLSAQRQRLPRATSSLIWLAWNWESPGRRLMLSSRLGLLPLKT